MTYFTIAKDYFGNLIHFLPTFFHFISLYSRNTKIYRDEKNILFLTLFCFSANGICSNQFFTSAKIKSATVYSNSAELLQSASVTLPSGTSPKLLLKKRSRLHVNENTIQIGAPANVTILSVQFTRNFISEYEIDESNPTNQKKFVIASPSLKKKWVKSPMKSMSVFQNH